MRRGRGEEVRKNLAALRPAFQHIDMRQPAPCSNYNNATAPRLLARGFAKIASESRLPLAASAGASASTDPMIESRDRRFATDLLA